MNTSLLPKRYVDSPSGKFIVDIVGRLLSFVPSGNNPIRYTEIEHILNPYQPIQIEKVPRLDTLVIPEGVKSLPADFMRGYHIDSKIIFPNTLEAIGDIKWEDENNECHCVLAKTYLPEVIIPKSVEIIGTYAFGGSHIKKLVFENVIRCEYARQFKDSQIEVLVIPKAMWESDGIAKNFKIHCSIGSLILT